MDVYFETDRLSSGLSGQRRGSGCRPAFPVSFFAQLNYWHSNYGGILMKLEVVREGEEVRKYVNPFTKKESFRKVVVTVKKRRS